jgi:hypothetical protein
VVESVVGESEIDLLKRFETFECLRFGYLGLWLGFLEEVPGGRFLRGKSLGFCLGLYFHSLFSYFQV